MNDKFFILLPLGLFLIIALAFLSHEVKATTVKEVAPDNISGLNDVTINRFIGIDTLTSNNAMMAYWDENTLRYNSCTNSSCSTQNTAQSLVTSSAYGVSLYRGSTNASIVYTHNDGANKLSFINCTSGSCSTRTGPYDITGLTISAHRFDGVVAKRGSDGFPKIVIAYFDGSFNRLTYIQCTSADCSSRVITPLISSGTILYLYPSLQMDSSGFARIAYQSLNTSTNAGSLAYFQCTNSSCSTRNSTTIESYPAGSSVYQTSEFLGGFDYPTITYIRSTPTSGGNNLRFVNCTFSSCATVGAGTPKTLVSNALSQAMVYFSPYVRVVYADGAAGNQLKIVECDATANCLTSVTKVLDQRTSDTVTATQEFFTGNVRVAFRGLDDDVPLPGHDLRSANCVVSTAAGCTQTGMVRVNIFNDANKNGVIDPGETYIDDTSTPTAAAVNLKLDSTANPPLVNHAHRYRPTYWVDSVSSGSHSFYVYLPAGYKGQWDADNDANPPADLTGSPWRTGSFTVGTTNLVTVDIGISSKDWSFSPSPADIRVGAGQSYSNPITIAWTEGWDVSDSVSLSSNQGAGGDCVKISGPGVCDFSPIFTPSSVSNSAAPSAGSSLSSINLTIPIDQENGTYQVTIHGVSAGTAIINHSVTFRVDVFASPWVRAGGGGDVGALNDIKFGLPPGYSTTFDADSAFGNSGWVDHNIANAGSCGVPPCHGNPDVNGYSNGLPVFTGVGIYCVPPPYNYYERGYLKFPTSSLPNNAQIVSAKLRLQVLTNATSPDFDVNIFPKNWTTSISSLPEDADVVWHTTPTGPRAGHFNTVDVPGSGIFTASLTDDPSLSSIKKTGSTGFELKGDPEPGGCGNRVVFQGTIQLVVNYRVPPGPNADYLVIANGVINNFISAKNWLVPNYPDGLDTHLGGSDVFGKLWEDFGKGKAIDWGTASNGVIPAVNGVFAYPSKAEIDNGSPPQNFDYTGDPVSGSSPVVLFINGNLNITSDLDLGTKKVVFIVKDDVVVGSAVSRIDGFFIASGGFNSGSGTSTLVVNGAAIAFGSAGFSPAFSLGRDLPDPDDLTNPAEIFNYDPSYLYYFTQKWPVTGDPYLGIKKSRLEEVLP